MLITLLGTLCIGFISSKVITSGFDCISVASKVSGVSNKDCSKWCLNNVKNEFDKNCIKIKVTSDAEGKLSANFCFDGWIVGHSLESTGVDKTYVALREFSNVETPQECQYFCQQTESCVNFQWKPPVNSASNCALKSNSHLVYAKVDSKRKSFGPNYCNEQNTLACIHAKNCKFDNACIWCSKTWLSGPQVCSNVFSFKRIVSNDATCTYDGKLPDEEPNPYTAQMDDMRNRLLLEVEEQRDANTGSMAQNSSDIPTMGISPSEVAEEIKQSSAVTTTLASGSIILLAAAGCTGGYYMYKKRKSRSRISDDLSDADTEEVPIESQIDEFL